MRKELLRTICVSTLILGASTALVQSAAYAQSADLTPIIINPEDVYKVDAEKPGNFYSKEYKANAEKLAQKPHKVTKAIRQDAARKPESTDSGEVVNLKSNLYDLQKNNNELKSALGTATQKIDVLQSFVDKQKLNEKYLTHRIKNIDDEIDGRAKKKISELKDQNKSLRETIKTANVSLKQMEEKIAGQTQQNSTSEDRQKQIQLLILSNEDLQKKIEGLEENVALLTQNNTELAVEIKSLKAKAPANDVVVSAKPVTDNINDNVFFKKEVISTEVLETKESQEAQFSSLELLKTDSKGSDIEYVRGEKEMISGTSDRDHMEKTMKVEANYPSLEETLPRKSFNN